MTFHAFEHVNAVRWRENKKKEEVYVHRRHATTQNLSMRMYASYERQFYVHIFHLTCLWIENQMLYLFMVSFEWKVGDDGGERGVPFTLVKSYVLRVYAITEALGITDQYFMKCKFHIGTSLSLSLSRCVSVLWTVFRSSLFINESKETVFTYLKRILLSYFSFKA